MMPDNLKLTGVREGRNELVCIVCPIGCKLKVTETPEGLEVTGNRCARGPRYAKEEFTAPTRTITGTCAVAGGDYVRVPVKTDREVPVESVRDVLVAMYEIRLTAPIRRGDIVAEGVGGTEANLVATMTIEEDADE